MSEQWNFHGFVAIPLETYGRELFGDSFLSADEIETGGFIEGMNQILSAQHSNSKKTAQFCKRCSPFLGKTATEIGKETIIELFDMFLMIYNK